MTTRVLLVEDHDLLADSLSAALSLEGYDVVRPPGLEPEVILGCAAEVQPHVVLLDLRLAEDRTAIPLIPALRDAGASVLMVTSERDKVALAECVEAGAIGLVHKSVPLEELIEAVNDVAQLRSRLSRAERDDLLQLLRDHRREDTARLAPFEQLTAREQEVLAGLMQGLSAEALAKRDFVSIATVRSQIRSILSKLGVGSQLAAVALARAADWKP
jgi:two-component system nitrate/nitrite response regulator NarL